MEAVHRSGGLTRGAQSHRIIVGTDGHAHLGDWDEASAALSMNLEAPEVREGQNYSVLSDIFSLGALYYEVLCGVHPLDSSRSQAKGVGDFPPEASPLITEGIRSLILAMIKENPLERISDLKQVLTLFEAALEAPVPELPPDLWPQRLFVGNLDELNASLKQMRCQAPIEISYIMDHVLRSLAPGQSGGLKIITHEVGQAIVDLRSETMPGSVQQPHAREAAHARDRQENTIEIEKSSLTRGASAGSGSVATGRSASHASAPKIPASKALEVEKVESSAAAVTSSSSTRPRAGSQVSDRIEDSPTKSPLPSYLGFLLLLGAAWGGAYYYFTESGHELRMEECAESASGFAPEVVFSDRIPQDKLELFKNSSLICDKNWNCWDQQSGERSLTFQTIADFPKNDFGQAYIEEKEKLLILKGAEKLPWRARPFLRNPDGTWTLSMTECLFSLAEKKWLFGYKRLMEKFKAKTSSPAAKPR